MKVLHFIQPDDASKDDVWTEHLRSSVGKDAQAQRVIDGLIERAVCVTSIRREEILGRSRVQHIVFIRHEVMREAFANGLSKSAIARAMGFDQTSVGNGIKRAQQRRDQIIADRSDH